MSSRFQGWDSRYFIIITLLMPAMGNATYYIVIWLMIWVVGLNPKVKLAIWLNFFLNIEAMSNAKAYIVVRLISRVAGLGPNIKMAICFHVYLKNSDNYKCTSLLCLVTSNMSSRFQGWDSRYFIIITLLMPAMGNTTDYIAMRLMIWVVGLNPKVKLAIWLNFFQIIEAMSNAKAYIVVRLISRVAGLRPKIQFCYLVQFIF